MMIASTKGFCCVVALGFLLVSSLFATEKKYRDYQSQAKYEHLFEIKFDHKTVTVLVHEGETELKYTLPHSRVSIEAEAVTIGDSIIFKRDGLYFQGRTYRYDSISDAQILQSDESVTIIFKKRDNDSDRPSRLKRGNLISFDRSLVVEDDEFVRGLIFSVKGDIQIYGEVNKDIVNLFGDVFLAPGAVARGDVATVTGSIDVASDASVYGELFSGSEEGGSRVHHFRKKLKSASLSATFFYNRVDGALPFGRIGFKDLDSLLPSVWVSGGYAFESECWRYSLGLEQTLWRKKPLVIGGEFYQRLASEDDWIISAKENTLFALLATEDFRDYYEAEGGTAYLNFKPVDNLTFETRFRSEETNWLSAQPHLWSLFGGNKLFRKNFSSITGVSRNEIDTTSNASLSVGLNWNTVDPEDPFSHSGWHCDGTIEWSHPDFGSDFDYRRYTMSARRYQKVHRHAMLLLRGIFGGSDGYMPVYKQFFLGGIGSLHGYKYKEYMGTRFWMVNTEYRIDFPRSDLRSCILWDVGQITNNNKFTSNDDIKHSIGIALLLGDNLRVSMSKRLDRSYNDEPRFHVRFDHLF
ncbi:MAG: hypothetical protein DRP47_03140 [Candidatus Zixiibacteriota bacterium]|nr:MAG: hypothetical protein DRP47_03140 [candidate division Zixibacteria bacterium]